MGTEFTPRGSQLEQYLLACWGRDGRVGWIIIMELLDLAKVHGYDKVFNAIKIAAEANVRNIRYVKGILAKEKKKSEPRPRTRINCSSCGKDHFADEKCPIDLSGVDMKDVKKNLDALFSNNPSARTL